LLIIPIYPQGRLRTAKVSIKKNDFYFWVGVIPFLKNNYTKTDKRKVHEISIKMATSKSNAGVWTLNQFSSMDFYHLNAPQTAFNTNTPS